MLLSENFSLAEASVSDTAARQGIDNSIPEHVLPRVIYTAQQMEKVRTLLGKPILVNSWYRCQDLNLAIGGAKSSQHMLGLAVDFISPKFGSPLDVVRKIAENVDVICYDQLIWEQTWVHISFALNPESARKELLTFRKGRYYLGIKD